MNKPTFYVVSFTREMIQATEKPSAFASQCHLARFGQQVWKLTGYDQEAAYRVPEARAYFQALHHDHPGWVALFTFDLPGNFEFLLSLLPTVPQRRADGNLAYDVNEFRALIEEELSACHRFVEQGLVSREFVTAQFLRVLTMMGLKPEAAIDAIEPLAADTCAEEPAEGFDPAACVSMNSGPLGTLTQQFIPVPVYVTKALAAVLRHAAGDTDDPARWDEWWYDVLHMSQSGIESRPLPTMALFTVGLGGFEDEHATHIRLSALLDAEGKPHVLFSLRDEPQPRPHPDGVAIAGGNAEAQRKRQAMLEFNLADVRAKLMEARDLTALAAILDLDDELGWRVAQRIVGPGAEAADRLNAHRQACSGIGSIPTVTAVIAERDVGAVLGASGKSLDERMAKARDADSWVVVAISAYGLTSVLVPQDAGTPEPRA